MTFSIPGLPSPPQRAGWCLCLLGSLCLAEEAPSTQGPAAPTHGYGELLKPVVKRQAQRTPGPYIPIAQHDTQDNEGARLAELEMFVGESRVFPAPGVARIAVGNGAILTAAALDNKEVILFANGAGTSSVFVWNEDGRYQRVKVSIVPGDTSRIAREIAAFLANIPQASTSIVGDKVIVEGDNLSDLDVAKIDELAKRYPQIVNFTNRVGWEQMVLLDVKVVEFPRNELQEIGLRWSAQGGAAIGAIWSPARRGHEGGLQMGVGNPPITATDGKAPPVPHGLNVLSAINMGLGAQLNLLAQQGRASVLSEPQLSARNGSKASFLVGGEYPYVVSTINGPSVFFKPYGIKLDIVPRVDRNGVVRATVDSEISEIDRSFNTTSGPALTVRKTSTEFNVRDGDTLVLSGLISRRSSNTVDKVPGLGDLPVLGALFRSSRFENIETELVVFVTPSIISSASPAWVDRLEKTRARLDQELAPQTQGLLLAQPSQDPESTAVLPNHSVGPATIKAIDAAKEVPVR
jgi:pilus assembly protein CpaC